LHYTGLCTDKSIGILTSAKIADSALQNGNSGMPGLNTSLLLL